MIVCHFFPKWLISPSLFLAHNALHSELILFMVLVLDSGEHLRLKMFYTIKQMQSADVFVCKFWDTGRSDSVLTTVGCCNLNWNEQHAARSGVQVLDILCTSISFDSFLYDLTVINDFNVMVLFFLSLSNNTGPKNDNMSPCFFISDDSVTTWN